MPSSKPPPPDPPVEVLPAEDQQPRHLRPHLRAKTGKRAGKLRSPTNNVMRRPKRGRPFAAPADPAKIGRPSKWSSAIAEQILARIRTGARIDNSAETCGIHRDTFYQWQREDRFYTRPLIDPATDRPMLDASGVEVLETVSFTDEIMKAKAHGEASVVQIWREIAEVQRPRKKIGPDGKLVLVNGKPVLDPGPGDWRCAKEFLQVVTNRPAYGPAPIDDPSAPVLTKPAEEDASRGPIRFYLPPIPGDGTMLVQADPPRPATAGARSSLPELVQGPEVVESGPVTARAGQGPLVPPSRPAVEASPVSAGPRSRSPWKRPA